MADHNPTENQGENADVPPPHTPEPIFVEHQAHPTEALNNYWESAKQWPWGNIIQTLLFIVTAIYVGLTYLLLVQGRENARSAQRAYVLFQGATLTNPLQVGSHLHATYVLKNTGATPALGIRTGAAFYLRKGDGTELEPEPGTAPFGTQRRDLGAGEHTIYNANRQAPLSQDEWQDLTSDKRRLFLIGETQYVDVFILPLTPRTKPDYTTFCAEFVMDKNGGGIFTPCGRFPVRIR